MLGAITKAGHPVIFTAPNADPAGRTIRAQIERYVAGRPDAWFVENLGTDGYYSLLHYVAVMVGNSSSGIIEAASFRLPVVNIGNRQKRRHAGANVLHAPADREAIGAAIATALSPQFRKTLDTLTNSYGDGNAARIVDALRATDWSPALRVAARFRDDAERA